MKKSLLFIAICLITLGVNSQSIENSFFDHVSYVGAFDGANNWAEGWAEFDPINKAYPAATATKGNGQFSRSTGIHITANETWSGTIKLDGWVYVDNGATLTIEPGTVIRGTQKSVLIVERGAKIMAVGTKASPIVFTSNQAAGLRANSDWGGLVICGKAPNNLAGGVGTTEGGIESQYGGTDPADNSGVLKYVRIEFPGFEIATGSEVNGLTLCSVGNGTSIDYVQVSNSGDDGYEWFGGSVSAKHIISYKTEDDDFDTDNGFSGLVQFALISRDKNIYDSDTGNGFESDNDAAGSASEPFTHAVFSNVSAFGPFATKGLELHKNHEEGAAMRLRRSTRLQIYNSLFEGWGRGVRIESDNSLNAAVNGQLVVRNTVIAGVENDKYKVDGTVLTAATLETWFLDAAKRNKMLDNNADAKIAEAFNSAAFNFGPTAGSPLLNASYWYTTSASKPLSLVKDGTFSSYPNPFNKTTTLKLSIDKSSYVRVAVYNSNGVLVSNLQDGELYEGSYNFRFDASALPKGMYIGKALVGNEISTLKIVAR